MYSKLLCINNWDAFFNITETTSDVDSAETEILATGQREHDVRVSRQVPWMAT